MTASAPSKETILVVDDEASIRRILETRLSMIGYNVVTACDGTEALESFQECNPDLVVLDVMMPGEDGLSVCRRLTAAGRVPVLMLTALGEETDRIVGLEIGADDYLPKPFNPRELLARIKAILRRSERVDSHGGTLSGRRIGFGHWVLDTDRRLLIDADGAETELTTSDFKLLTVLLERPRFVLSRDQLLDLTAGRTASVFDRTIDNQISRLRRKVEADAARPRIITTVRGGGYCLAVDVHELC